MKTQNKKVNLFLDSGAFSAWTQGTEINIQEYIEFIKQHEHLLTVYANLDVIGDPVSTWKNQKIMEKAGLQPMPVYHLDDPLDYLHKYLCEYDYIGLGGMARGVQKFTRIEYLDRCFGHICNTPTQIPKIKIHGFGMTSLQLMLRYPWYSVDSTSWVVTGRVGAIYTPWYREGQGWMYDINSWKISVSNKSPDLKNVGQHINTLSPLRKELVLHYIHEKGYKLGKSEFKMEKQNYELKENEKWSQKKPKDKTEKREVEIIIEPGISNKYQLRDEMNIIYFLDLEKSMPKWPWAFKTKGAPKGMF